MDIFQSKPLPGAITHDWTDKDLLLTMITHNKNEPDVIYSTSVITPEKSKIKGRRAKNAMVLFALPVLPH